MDVPYKLRYSAGPATQEAKGDRRHQRRPAGSSSLPQGRYRQIVACTVTPGIAIARVIMTRLVTARILAPNVARELPPTAWSYRPMNM
jgi:hypothetical protein